ncbi:MAG TPA: PAS domain S-box protein [Candidatus Acidoferrum sp.]|nr:PAS domain S-box protein [Candidatus Acidoferrum sp.]
MFTWKTPIRFSGASGRLRFRLVSQLGLSSSISGLAVGLSVLLGDGAGVGIFPFLFPVCVVSAWIGGMAGGSLATLFLAIGAAYYHLPPAGMAVADSGHLLALAAFVLTGLLLAWLVGALQQSRDLLNCTLISIGDAVITTDRKNRVQRMNPLAEALTGTRRAEAFGKPLGEVLRAVIPSTGQNMETVGADVIRKKRTQSLPEDAVLVDKSGNLFPLDDSVAPIRLRTGDVVGAVIVFRDATNRRRTEAARVEAETRYREIFENAVVGMFQSTPDGRYLRVNQAMASMHGYISPEAMVAATTDIAHQEYEHPAQRDEFMHLLEEKKVVTAFPLEVSRRDGTRLSTIVHARVVSDADGKIQYYEGTQEDITARKRLQAQLEHAQKMEAVGRLAGGVAHDFNNVLHVIYGYSDLAMEKVDANHPVLRDITRIKEAAKRATRLTKQLLAFSRQQAVEPAVLDLNKLISGWSQMLQRLVGEDINIFFQPGDALGLVLADHGHVEQILMNLAVNARDAMPLGGTIRIVTGNITLDKKYAQQHPPVLPGPYVMLSFSDTGHGIDRNLLQKIFEPFFTTKESGKGTGLGLATVYGIVKQSGGNIWVYSEPGVGTTFKIYLPRVDRKEALPQPAPLADFTGGNETILLVEDDTDIRDLVAAMLKAGGYNVLVAESPSAALHAAHNSSANIALLLTDIIMPEMSGVELCQRIRAARPAVRQLYMTGYPGSELARRGLLESDAEILEKPFEEHDLLARVRAVLDRDASGSISQ